MFDWDQDFDEITGKSGLPHKAKAPAVPATRGRIRRALLTVGLPAVVVASLFAAPGFAPASSTPALGAFGLSRFALDMAMPEGLLSYDQAQYDNFRRGIARFSDSELLAYAAATRRDQANSRLTFADWHRDALRLTELEIARRGLVVSGAVGTRDVRPVPANAI